MRHLSTLTLAFILVLLKVDAFNTASKPIRFLRQNVASHTSSGATHTSLTIHSSSSNTLIAPCSKITLKGSSSSSESGKPNFVTSVESYIDINDEKSQTPWAVTPTMIKRFAAASTIISLLALGLQQPAYANALDIIQEKVELTSCRNLYRFLLTFSFSVVLLNPR